MSFNLKIVNITDNIDNMILVSGLTIEILKIKYNWILNASVRNCIIGEDQNGLVWFSGEWICGDWMDGTWYSGIWHDGTWYNGRWYSYLIDKAMVISNRFVILDKNKKYSIFKSGNWISGDFYDGIFGDEDRDVLTEATYIDLMNKNYISAYWHDGKFHNGLFKNSIWLNGIFYNGNMESSYWLNGKFYSGTFNFHDPQGCIKWHNGIWYGGDFIEGVWGNGSFEQINVNIKSRFGTSTGSTSNIIWWGGNFYNGEFHSGLNIDSYGNTLPSINNMITHWFGGNFVGGKWYGGHFHTGTFQNGIWYGGIFNDNIGDSYRDNCIWENGKWYNGLWINGVFKNGHFYSGIWLNGLFLGGYLSTNDNEYLLDSEILINEIELPSVTAITTTSITMNSGIIKSRVTDNGGSYILDRGICWSIDLLLIPVTGINSSNQGYISEGGTMGDMFVQMNDLLPDTTYYIRAYATNMTGLTYSNLIDFKTLPIPNGPPVVITLSTESADILQKEATIRGQIISSGDTAIIKCGFDVSIYDDLSSSTRYDLEPGSIDGNGKFSQYLEYLTEGTTYYFRAYAENSGGISYGSINNFTTLTSYDPYPATIVIEPIENILDTTAIAKAKITDPGNSPVTEVGFCWSLSPEPTILNYFVSKPYSEPSFDSIIEDLIPSTTYYIRAYVINGTGYCYSSELSFTTLEFITTPEVIMISVTTD